MGLVFTCQGNKTNGGDLPGDHLIVISFLQQQQLLGHEAAADRDDHAAAGCQLLHQRGRDVTRGRRHDNCVEGCMRFPPVIAVSKRRRS